MINLFELAYSLENGKEIIPFASFGGQNIKFIPRISQSNKLTEFIISHSRDKIELVETEIVLQEAVDPYSKKVFHQAKRIFIEDGAFISYTYKDKTLILSENFRERFDSQKISEIMACEFIATICSELNPTVYRAFTEVNNSLKKFNSWKLDVGNIINNLMGCIENLDSLEKVIKTLGVSWLYENIGNPSFEINVEKRKVHQIVQTPIEALKILKKLKLESYSVVFSELTAINPNYAIMLANHLFELKQLHGTPVKAWIVGLEPTLHTVVELLKFDKFELKTLLNYCYRESARYFQLNDWDAGIMFPRKVIRELFDYITFAKQLGTDCKYDPLPKNLKLAFYTLKTNSSILIKPRTEEFNQAVAGYKHLEWKSEQYEFRTPIDEADLFNEGNQLAHYIAGYRDRIIDGCQIIFMRKIDEPNTPFVTIEVEGGVIIEAKQKFNMDIEDSKVIDDINKWLEAIERKMNK